MESHDGEELKPMLDKDGNPVELFGFPIFVDPKMESFIGDIVLGELQVVHGEGTVKLQGFPENLVPLLYEDGTPVEVDGAQVMCEPGLESELRDQIEAVKKDGRAALRDAFGFREDRNWESWIDEVPE